MYHFPDLLSHSYHCFLSASMIPLAAYTDDPSCSRILREACDRFGFVSVDTVEAVTTPYYLQFYVDRIALIATDGLHGDIELDLTSGRAAHRLHYGGGKKQPLARAVGLHRWKSLSVVDATAGFATDAAVLASLGADVTLIERCPPLACMLEHAITRTQNNPKTQPLGDRLTLAFTDSIEWMTQHQCDVVYLDPMYPHTGKSAQVKKNMQALRVLAGPDTDSYPLLLSALACATRRVVVKRPRNAPPLHRHDIDSNHDASRETIVQPDTAIHSPNTRYDIYSTNIGRHSR